MKLKTKTIYLNVGILVGLLFELHRGRPLYVVLIAATLLFAVANAVLFVISSKVGKK